MGQYIDYKFWYIFRDDYNRIKRATVRFYTGDYKKVKKKGIQGEELNEEVTAYIRDGELSPGPDLDFLSTRRTEKNIHGKDIVTYTDLEFGEITDLDDLRLFLNNEIAKHPTKTPETKQSELTDKSKVK